MFSITGRYLIVPRLLDSRLLFSRMLGEKERLVLAASCLDAELSVEAIAERTGLKPHIVRRCLHSIESSGAVQKLTYLDVYPLGYLYYEIFISFQPGHPHKAKIINLLENSPYVSYIEQISGRFEYAFNIMARDPFQVSKIFDEIADLFPAALADKKILVIESLIDYPLRFLAPHITGKRALGFGNNANMVDIDELDHQILQKLSRAVTKNVSDLARSLGAKVSTVQYRLERLKSNGVIVGSRYFANLFRLGYHLFDIHVSTRGRSQSVREAMHAFADQEPAVYLLIQCIGEWDFTMCAAVESGQAVDGITERLAVALGTNLQRVTTQTVIKHHKLSFYPLNSYQPRRDIGRPAEIPYEKLMA